MELDHRLLLAQNYAILNPMQVESSLWHDLATEPLAPRKLQLQPHLLPRLLDLGQHTDEERIALLDRCKVQRRHSRKPFFSALLKTKASSTSIVAHLSRQLLVKGPEGNQVLLRFFDPAVFRHLHWLFSAYQMDALLGPIATWTWRGWGETWQTYHQMDSGRSYNRLSAPQWETLQRLGLLNRSLRVLKRESPDLRQDASVARQLDLRLRDAYEQHGLEEDHDRCLYAEQALRFHPDIHRHPRLREYLARARTEKTSYAGACSDLRDASLRDLIAELGPADRTTRTTV